MPVNIVNRITANGEAERSQQPQIDLPKAPVLFTGREADKQRVFEEQWNLLRDNLQAKFDAVYEEMDRIRKAVDTQ